MEGAVAKEDEEASKSSRRLILRRANLSIEMVTAKSLDSALKRHTALIKRMKQSLAAENRDANLKDIETLSLEKYVEEIAGAAAEGLVRCKTDKDVWSAVETISALHRRFPSAFTPLFVGHLHGLLAPPTRTPGSALALDLKEKEDSARVARQRPCLRVASELAMVGVITDVPGRSGGEWIMKVLKDLLSNDPGLTSLPLLTTFLKSFRANYLVDRSNGKEPSPELGAMPTPSEALNGQATELIEKEVKDRFTRMCHGYFEKVSKKLVNEYNRLQDQDRRNHEAYIRSGEIFEDRQQAYEKMTKSFEKVQTGCQSLSDLLHLPMPTLKAAAQQQMSIGVSSATSTLGQTEEATVYPSGGIWEDDEEQRFYEDLTDLADFLPKSALGIQTSEKGDEELPMDEETKKATEEAELLDMLNREIYEVERAQEDASREASTNQDNGYEPVEADASPRAATPEDDGNEPDTAAPGNAPSQVLTTLLARLPNTTTREAIDQAAIDFAFVNSKAARKRLVKFLGQVPKNRTDLIPFYSRLVATLNRYFPDVGTDMVAVLEEEFRYLNRKRTVTELLESRMKNIAYISALVKFRVVPAHSILHMVKVYLDDFTGTNIESVALILEGCGRFLMRNPETRERMTTMIELMRRKQAVQHFDQRQILLLENAYYQCNPPERAPREEKDRSETELFIRHLLLDVLSKKTLDKVLRLFRKLDWNLPEVRRLMHKYFSKPWKMKHSHISHVAMLVYDLQRYHPDFVITIVDQILEDFRRGLEHNIYTNNQRQMANIKYIGELYIYRVLGSSIIFDTLWSLTTFGHPDGRPLPDHPCSIDAPDDFFRLRLTCSLLDTCGMCFDRGSQKKKLDDFLSFLQVYVACKDTIPMDVEFVYLDTLEALRPKLVIYKTFADAAKAVDDRFESIANEVEDDLDDPDADSDRSSMAANGRDTRDLEDQMDEQIDERSDTTDPLVVRPSGESLGPSEEADSEFAKELARMMAETSSEARKVDRRTAQALWDSSGAHRKKRADQIGGSGNEEEDPEKMKFTVLSRRGHKQQVHELSIPSISPLAIHTRSAQLQDKAEHEELKRLVLNYEQREEEASRYTNVQNPREYG